MKKVLLLLLTLMIGFCTLQLSAQETVVIGSGTTTNSYLPSYSFYNYSLTQQLYTPEEIGTAGSITSIAFFNSGSEKTRNYTVYMVNTTKTSFAGSSDWITVSASDEVFTGSVTLASNAWTTLTLATPFVYDGASNLAIIVDDNTGSYSSGLSCYVFDAPNMALRVYNDGTNYDPFSPGSYSGTVMNVKNQLQLVITAGDIACHSTGALVVSNVTSSNATITWGMPEDGGTYIVQYKTAAQNWDDVDVVTETTIDTTFDFSNMLASNTSYNVRVANYCGGTDTSVWRNASFITSNVAVQLPYNQDFETNPETITDFTIENHGSNGWYIGSATGMQSDDPSVTTTHSLYISNDNGTTNSYSNSSASDSYAILDVEFDNDPLEWHLAFDYNVNGEGTSTKYDYLSVYLVDGGVAIPTSGAPSGTALLYQSNLLSGWTHFDIILQNVIGTSKRIVFYWRNDSSSGSNPPAAVDNISIVGQSCMQPTNLAVSDQTTEGATITWQGDASEYALYLSGAMSGYYTSYSNSYTFTGLNPSSTYTVQVRALCGGDSSTISLPVSFNTACDAITITDSDPWTEDFESYVGDGATPFICWETPVTYNASNGVAPFVYCNYGDACHSGLNSGELKGTMNMLVLPEFTNDIHDLRLSFWATYYGSGANVVVGVISDVTDTATFEPVGNAGTPGPRGGSNAGNGNYMGPFDFNGVQAASGRIALRFTGNANAGWNVDDFTVQLAPDCPSPVKTSVQVSNIGGHIATVSFVDNDETHNSWTVYYREADADENDPWMSVTTTTNEAGLSNLDPETDYEVYVITNCGTPQANPDATLTATFTTTVACPAPTAITLSSVSTDEATVTWTCAGTAYNVEYGPTGFTPGTGTTNVATTESFTMSNLTPNTAYTILVANDCSADNDGTSTSASFNFTTTQIPVDLPYAADFSDPTDEWVLNNGNCSNFWMMGTVNNVNALFITNDSVTPGYNTSSYTVVTAEKLITVGDNASFNITFDVNVGGESSYDYIKVFFAPATSAYPASTSSTYFSDYSYSTYAMDFSEYLSQTGSSSYPYKLNLTQGNTLHVEMEMANPNTAPDATSTAKLVFMWKDDTSSGTQPGAVISNVSVMVNNCPAPTALSDSNITTTSADIYWTPGDEETEWEVEYGVSGFAHGAGTVEPISGDPAFTLDNLSAATHYDVYVRAMCSATDSSLWVGPLTFVTNCDIITSLPYTENFDSYTASTSTRPDCWSFPITYSNAPYITSSYNSSAPNSLYFNSQTATPTTAVTPQFDADINTLRVKFMLKAESTSYSGTFEVGVMSNPNDVSTFESVRIIQPSNTNWNQYVVDLDSTTMTGGGKYIAFRQHSNSSSWYYWLDDVMVMPIPACLEPTGLAASNVTTTSVDLTWNSNDNDFNLYYKKPSDNDWTVEPNVSLNNGVYTLTNLTPTTTYFWRVANLCSDGSESFSDMASFSTTMEETTIPYTTDFSAGSDQAWMLNNGSCVNYWTIGAADANNDALFVTTDGTTPGYTYSSYAVVTAEKLFTVGDAAEFNISFDVLAGGEGSWDYMKVFLAPASSEFPATSSSTAPDYATYSYSVNAVDFSDYLASTGYSSYPYKLNLTNGTLHVEVIMPNPNDNATTTSTAKLVFLWKNDGSVCTQQPGAVIYNVSISALSCPKPTGLTVSNISSSTADISWTPGGSESSWIVEYKASTEPTWTEATVTTPSYQLTSLNTLTAYDVRVKADCGDGDESTYALSSFTTIGCDESDACGYTFVLGDGYGDGWNGASLTVEQNGVVVATLEATDYDFEEEQTYDTVVVNLCDGISTNLVWHSGSYDDEASVTLIGPDGTQLYNVYDLEENYSSPLFTFTTNCSGSGPVITNPTVTTTAATGMTQNSATLNGTITNPDNVTITAKGFEWKVTTGGNYQPVNVTGNTLTYNLTGLAPATGYTYKAFITYNGTTVYGDEVSFTTLPQGVDPCDVPTGLHATNVQNESIDITWDAVSGATGYNIQYRVQGQSAFSSATANTNSYTINGLTGNTTYEIQVQSNCGNGNLSDWSAFITVLTHNDGIESHLENSVVLFPNPAREYIDVRIDGDVNVSMMEVYDVYGKLISNVNVVENPTRINVSGLANGMYFVRVTTEAGVVTKSFVKK